MIKKLNIILADDDKDDSFLFAKALRGISPQSVLKEIRDGEDLMCFLADNLKDLPDVIFLDLNMPRKNGAECLTEIKQNSKLKQIPIVIYSTSFHNDILDLLYKYGATYCIRKPTTPAKLKMVIQTALSSIAENKLIRPKRENFILPS